MVNRSSMLIFAIALAVSACGKKDETKGLPPATGEGAPALPTLPSVAVPAAPASAAASDRKATGTLLPRSEVTVVARARGVVSGLTVDVGARVTKGQVLFRVDDREAGLRLVQAQTQLLAAEQQQKSTAIEYDRTKLLYEQKAVTPQQWDQITARLDAAKVGVAQAQSGVAMAQKAVADAITRAPIAGVVVSRTVALGDFVSDGTKALVVQDQGTLELRFRLPERALATVKLKDALTVSVPALALTRPATVAIIAPNVDPQTRTIELTAVLDNADGALRPGLMADVELGAAPPAEEPAPSPATAAPASAAPAAAAPAAKAAAPSTR